jgi:hypothetical protein
MKHLSFLFILFIWLAVFACTNEISHQTETEHEQGIEQEQPGQLEQTEIEEPEIRPPNEETPETEQTVIEPPITEPPETERPEQPVIEPLEQVPLEQVPLETEPPVIELPIVEPPIIEPPFIEPPIIELPIIEPPEIEEPETPEVIPPVVEPPTNALLVINELRTEIMLSAKRAEYIEFKVMQTGNLNGINLNIMNNAKNPFVYNFPAINVSLGEYITLHLRTLENNCKDELGDNLALSGGTDSCPTARDLWVEGSVKYLYKTDIVYLEDEGGNVMDAVVLSEKPSSAWGKDYSHFAEIEEFLFYEGAWKAANGSMPTPLDVVDTSSIKTATVKSVCRYEGRENSNTAGDWYVTSVGTTPGLANK